MKLTREETQRYHRHLILPDVGESGQIRLKNARILVVGAGGLGAPVGLYLAAAGVGKLGIVDFDAVDVTNLQRQITFDTSAVGTSKVDAAAARLSGLNPHIDIVTHSTRLTRDNAMGIIEGYDIVVDGTDNFATRYLVNDACVLLGKPNVYGSIFRFDGQASVFNHDGGPCYRCLYPEPPPPDAVPSCAEGGVLGVLPGIVGSMQATEAIKIVLGAGKVLSGRLVMIDALTMTFRELTIRRDPKCPVCGDNPSITELIDYEEFCGNIQQEESENMIPEIGPAELKRRMDAGDDIVVLDVREPHEHQMCNIGDSTLIPMGEIPARMMELDAGKETIVYCRTGNRSMQVAFFLQQSGFDRVFNLRGGIHAWSDEVDPSIPKY